MTDPIFQRSLQDLIKGIRTHKKDLSAYISQTIAEIKTELRSTDPYLKAEAVRKLTYLQMIGYNVSWASFSIVEVMSQPRFAHKRIGYLAANQTFDESTDVILLTTNLFKKEFSSNSSSSQYEVGLAVNCLANIATKELARDCISDLVLLMNHSRPYIRKKAILAMYKLYVKFPQGLRLTFDKLNDRLDDPETSVVSTAVNVICELANKNPKNYLAMAPKFFRLLTTSANNWMLIKVVKLLGSLVSEEPRLARKLLEPLATIIENTSAKSLQYECIYTITEALPYSKREDGSEAKNAVAVISLCSSHLRKLIEESDQNLKYLGLVGLCNLLKSSPRSVVEHRDIILTCLNDDDITIRTKALELLAGIVSKKSLADLVRHLMQHAKRAEGLYREEIISKILGMCRRDKYSMVNDFAWYISILLDLAVMPGAKHGNEVADQLMEIALRVDAVRPFAVETMLSMLFNDSAVLGNARSTVVEVLKAAAWIVGEYSDIVSLIANDTAGDDAEDDEDDSAYWIEGGQGDEIRSLWRGQHIHLQVVETLFHPRTTTFSSAVQNVYLQSALKIFVRSCEDCDFHEVADIIGVLRDGLPLFLQNIDLEVQERASTFRHLLAEFQILPLNWEESSDLVKQEQSVDGGTNATSLLDLMPVYTSSSVRTIDETGARIAMQKKAALASLSNEKFYAVHSKAQKRVPVPDNLNIEAAFNASALAKLMNVDIPEQLSLASICLVKDLTPKWTSSQALSSTSIASLALDDDDHFKYSRPLHEEESSPLPVTAKFAEHGYKAPVRTAEEEVFMLSSKKHDDLLPLSKILGEHFEEIPSRQSRKKDHKKSSKGKKKSSAEVNFQDMLPAGALSSDEEASHAKAKHSHKRASKSVAKREMDPEDVDDLQAVDITTPLRDDEVLTVPTHRVVPSYPASYEQKGESKEKSHKKEKKDKRDKSEPKKDKKSKKDKVQAAESADLLTLDWQASPTNAPAAPANSNNHSDFLGLTSSPVVSPALVASSSGTNDAKKASSSSSSSSHHYYCSAFSGRHCDVAYYVLTNEQTLTLHWKVTNHSSESANITVTAQMQASAVVKDVLGGKAIEICRNLGSNSTSKAASTTFVLTQHLHETITIPVAITVSASSSHGPEVNSVQVGLKIHSVCSNQPYKLDESEFMEKMTKSSSKWASASIQVPCASKPKHAFKTVAHFLRAHLVETESSKAASMSAKSANGCKLFVLAKAVSGGAGMLQVDVKCLGASQTASQDIATATVAALKDIQL